MTQSGPMDRMRVPRELFAGLRDDAADQKHQDLIRDVFGRNRCERRGDDAPE